MAARDTKFKVGFAPRWNENLLASYMTEAPNGAGNLPGTLVESALHRAGFQSLVFAEAPRRADLMRAAADMHTEGAPIRLRVHRNHTFEFIASLLPAFSAYAGRSIEVEIGDYDDSLSLTLDGAADVELIWLDYERYKLAPEELSEWLKTRVQAMRNFSQAPVLIAAWSGSTRAIKIFNEGLRIWSKEVAGVRVIPLDEIAQDLADDYLDQRMASVGATRLSDRANVTLARLFGLCWLPAVLEPRLKAVVFDLDNTLWGGVLGEDGYDGVTVEKGYEVLQEKAVELAETGLFLGILSRNEAADVEAMFASGRLRLPSEKVSQRSVSWGRKADGMAAIAKALRIGFDAILFVDDNPGELAAVASACPGIKILHATSDPLETCRALSYYPGLFSWGSDAADMLRSADLTTNDARQDLRAQASDETDYLASLQLELRVAVDPVAHRDRLHQLSQKTNQFNLALQRLSETDVAEVLEARNKHAVAMWLTDRFSESGLIAAMFVSTDGAGVLSVDELCVSCRALGRGVEDTMMVAAIDAVNAAYVAAGAAPITSVRFVLQEGARNGPAHSWLQTFSGQTTKGKELVILPWTDTPRLTQARSRPIRIEKGEPDANQ